MSKITQKYTYFLTAPVDFNMEIGLVGETDLNQIGNMLRHGVNRVVMQTLRHDVNRVVKQTLRHGVNRVVMQTLRHDVNRVAKQTCYIVQHYLHDSSLDLPRFVRHSVGVVVSRYGDLAW